MSVASGPAPRPPRGILALWRARPSTYSRRAWLATLVLDLLPWPLGEEILAKAFVVKAFLRPGRLRAALTWAERQHRRGAGRWRLALSSCEHHGRFVARRVLLGIRSPEDVRRHVVVRGGEHLSSLATGALLIGFHLGPPGPAVMLRVAGYEATWMGRPRASRSWSREAWRRIQRSHDALTILNEAGAEGGLLYRARRLLLGGGTIYVAADGNRGREAFRVSVPGGTLFIRSGWLVLRRQCKVPVLPVVTHLEGRTHVIEIRPPLPPPVADEAADIEACRTVLAPMLADYVRRFPEQCPRLMLRSLRGAARSGNAGIAPDRRRR